MQSAAFDLEILTDTVVRKIGAHHVEVQSWKGRATKMLAADLVAYVIPGRPNRDLFLAAQRAAPEAYIVGDANSPRYLEAAIREGYLAGREI